ncbi:hypothetical protein BC941DRAFT_439505 [Chlamydoabsidia padenii]|nr:hypothetical protein BC941DRAFT_439505 [Chlamydoabsidia padenii]
MLAFKSIVTLTTLVALSTMVSAFGSLAKRGDCGSADCTINGRSCSDICAGTDVGKGSLEHYCYGDACYCGFSA